MLVATRHGEFAGFVATSGDRFTAHDALARPLVMTPSIDDARAAIEALGALRGVATSCRVDAHTRPSRWRRGGRALGQHTRGAVDAENGPRDVQAAANGPV